MSMMTKTTTRFVATTTVMMVLFLLLVVRDAAVVPAVRAWVPPVQVRVPASSVVRSRRPTAKKKPVSPASILSTTVSRRPSQPHGIFSTSVPEQQDLPIDEAATSVQELQDNRKGLHLGLLAAGTLWWYAFSTYSFFQADLTTGGFFADVATSVSPLAVDALAVYTTVSQLIVYGCMWRLASAPTLRRAQAWTVACIAVCVPADISVVLFDPTGSEVLTVLAFALVTMIFALYFVHYVRLAAVREERSFAAAQQRGAAILLHDNDNNDGHHHALHPDGPWGELRDYRPPQTMQSFHMAVEFTRSFVAFTLAMAGFRDAFSGQHETGSAAVLVIASCSLVAAHTAVEMILTTVFPGSDLEEYKSFNVLDATVYFFHIASASVIGHESAFGETIWDELLYSWLFGNAVAKFFGSLELLGRDIDFDASLGLKKQAPLLEAIETSTTATTATPQATNEGL